MRKTIKKPVVSAIIPAYNKEERIGEVLQVLLACSTIDETICIYDGYDEKTLDIILSFKKVKLIHALEPKGKSYALATGIKAAKGKIILFIDADITGLTGKSINRLIEPLQNNKYDATIGYRSSRMEATVGVPIGGERAYFRKDLLPHLPFLKRLVGYGAELYLNYHFRYKRKKFVKLYGVYSFAKHLKYSRKTALRLYVSETYQVLYEMFRRGKLDYMYYSYIDYVHFYQQPIGSYFSTKAILEKLPPLW